MKLEQITQRPQPRIKFKYEELKTLKVLLWIHIAQLERADIVKPLSGACLQTSSHILVINKALFRIGNRLNIQKKEYVIRFNHVEAIALIFILKTIEATNFPGFVINFTKQELIKHYNL